MFNRSTRQMLANMGIGLRVDRAAATHAAATTPYFTVTGDILLTGLTGKITVAAGACDCSWQANPTAGTTVLFAQILDINPALVGDLLSVTGVLATAMTYGGAVVGIMQPLAITAGTIDLIAAAADGATSWSLWYLPMSLDATVVTA